jgi:hypothetical protein
VRHEAAGVLESESFDIDDLCGKACGIYRGLALLDVFRASRD